MTQLNIREDKKLCRSTTGVMIPNFTSVLPITTNSSHHRGSLPTRAHGSRSFIRSRGAACATLTRTPLRRSLSAMVGMSFSATRVSPSKPNLSTQKPHRPLHVHTRTQMQQKKNKVSRLEVRFIPPSPSFQQPIPRPCLFRVPIAHADSLRVQSRRCPDAGTSMVVATTVCPSAVIPQTGSLVARYISVPNRDEHKCRTRSSGRPAFVRASWDCLATVLILLRGGRPCRPGSKMNITRSIGCWNYDSTPRPIRFNRHPKMPGLFRA